MIEIQFLNKVLTTKDKTLLTNPQITPTHFEQRRDEYLFLIEHAKAFGVVCDRETFLNKFRDFTLLEVYEPNEALIFKLHEELTFRKITPILKRAAELINDDSFAAAKYLVTELEGIKVASNIKAYDIISQAKDRLDAFMENKGKEFTTTGFVELDEKVKGWRKGELVCFVGRPKQGKSWVLLKSLIGAWLSGKRVLLYSGEMGVEQVGYRFDTLHKGFSNGGLFWGSKAIQEDYTKYINELTQLAQNFYIVTPKELGGFLTISKLKMLIDQYKPDVVGIDQYSLMEDETATKHTTLRLIYVNLSRDLFNVAETLNTTILTAAQSNRQGKKEDSGTPELENIGESDAIAQYSTKVFAIRKVDGNLKINCVANRYGEGDFQLMYNWDINTGRFTNIPVIDEKRGGGEAEVAKLRGRYVAKEGSKVF